MNMDIKDLPRIWQELNKTLVYTIVAAVVALTMTALTLPRAITAISEKSAVQAEYDQLYSSVQQRITLLNSQPQVLQQNIEETIVEAQALAIELATAEQANAVMAGLYNKATQAGVSVTRIDPITELQGDDAVEIFAYDKQQVVVEAVGTAQNLILFLELVSDFGVPSYHVEDVAMSSDTSLVLSFDVIGYSSDYAGATAIALAQTGDLIVAKVWR